MSTSDQPINLILIQVVLDPVPRLDRDAHAPVRTALRVPHIRIVRDQTLPTEVVPARVARHVIAAAVLVDVDAALGARFGAHGAHFGH